MSRVIMVVLDSLGVGCLPDAERFGDEGTNTLKRMATLRPNMNIPHMLEMGLGCIEGVDYFPCSINSTGAVGRSKEASEGKDTTTGHWEIAGLLIDQPFKTYPKGFPSHVIEAFEREIGRKTLCNQPYSGTDVIRDFGEEHIKTGFPIIYTSADSVFQVAAHEEVISVDELYRICEIARQLLMGEDQVARVIARPFIGEKGQYTRTSNRHDYSIKPFGKTVLDDAVAHGLEVKAVGKIVDIFDGEGITESVHTISNMDGVDKTLDYMKQSFDGIIFTNLVDFDAKYGHRRNVEGYREAVEAFDARLPEIISQMQSDDVLFLLADHGNDPGHHGTDHTREYIPIIAYGSSIKGGANIGTRETFSDIAATVADLLQIPYQGRGVSFKKEMIQC